MHKETRPAVVKRTGGMSVRDIVFVLFRRKWVLLVVSIPIIAVGAISLAQQTSAFLATSTVLVELNRVDLPRWDTSGRLLDTDRELSTMFNIAMSIPVGEIAAEALIDSIPAMRQLSPRLNDLESTEDLRNFLLGGIDVSVVGESTILDFTFGSAHPRLSLMAVEALSDAFVSYQVFGRKSKEAVAYYDEQIRTVRGEIDSLLVLRGEVLQEMGYSTLEAEIRFDAGQLADLDGQLREATANRIAVELNYKYLSEALDGDPLDFPIGLDESRSFTLVHWRNVVSKHQDELNSILTLHTDDSIPARRHEDLLERSLTRLSQEERAFVESLRIDLASLQAREDIIREQVEEVREKNMRAPDTYRRVSLIDVEIDSLRKVLRDLQGKRGEVRLSSGADERVSSVVRLTAPELVENLAGSRTAVYLVLLIVLALGLGVVAALIVENMDHRVYGPVDVEEHLQLPVYASVTKVK